MEGKKILRKCLIRVLFIALTLAFAFFSFFIISFGWFSKNTVVSGNGIVAKLFNEDIQVKYYVYMWNLDTNTGSDLDKYGELISVSDITMNPYDLIFKAVNKYTPVVIRVAITGSDMPAEGSAVVTIERDASIGTYSTVAGHTNDLSEYSSSIIRITAAAGAEYYAASPQGGADISTIYNRVVNGDVANGITAVKGHELDLNTKTFTTAAANGSSFSYTKLGVLTFTIPYSQEDWNDTNGDSVADTLNIYLLMDYDTIAASGTVPSLIDIYCSEHGIVSTGSSFDNMISLKNDLVRIKADRLRNNG